MENDFPYPQIIDFSIYEIFIFLVYFRFLKNRYCLDFVRLSVCPSKQLINNLGVDQFVAVSIAYYRLKKTLKSVTSHNNLHHHLVFFMMGFECFLVED